MSEPVSIDAPMQATVVSIEVAEGELVRAGQDVAVLESMKMEHVVTAEHGGRVSQVAVAAGDTVLAGQPLLLIAAVAEPEPPADETAPDGATAAPAATAGGGERADLAEVLERHALGTDERRPDAV